MICLARLFSTAPLCPPPPSFCAGSAQCEGSMIAVILLAEDVELEPLAALGRFVGLVVYVCCLSRAGLLTELANPAYLWWRRDLSYDIKQCFT